MMLALMVGVLVAGGVYLLLQRSMVRIVFGISLLSHGANLILLSAGVTAWRGQPLDDRTAPTLTADPLPQAFVLTAIVITLAAMVIMLALSVIGHDDDTHRVPDTGETHDR
jgi:multicomponent Na+:H+ antiporter subunit C